MNTKHSLLLLFAMFSFFICKAQTNEKPTKTDTLKPDTIKSIKKKVIVPKKVKKLPVYPFKVLAGREWLDKKIVRLTLQTLNNGTPCYRVKMKVNFGERFPVPVIPKRYGKIKHEIADYYSISLDGFTRDGKHLLWQKIKHKSLRTQNNGLNITICPSELPHLNIGQDSIDLVFKETFENFFSHHSATVIRLKVRIPVKVYALLDKDQANSLEYEVMEGQDFIDSKEIRMIVTPSLDESYYNVQVKANLLHAFSQPGYEGLSAAHLKLVAYSEDNKRLFRVYSKASNELNYTDLKFTLTLAKLRRIAAGETVISLALETSKHKFVQIEIELEIPEVYKTKIYVSHLKLNKTVTKRILGSNDFWNSDPETALRIDHGNNEIYYEYTVNNFNLYAPKTITVYHLKNDTALEITISDRDDYNSNDLICKMVATFKELENPNFSRSKLKCVDEIKLYAKSYGKIN